MHRAHAIHTRKTRVLRKIEISKAHIQNIILLTRSIDKINVDLLQDMRENAHLSV